MVGEGIVKMQLLSTLGTGNWQTLKQANAQPGSEIHNPDVTSNLAPDPLRVHHGQGGGGIFAGTRAGASPL